MSRPFRAFLPALNEKREKVKWFSTSADGASFAVVMATTNPDASKVHQPVIGAPFYVMERVEGVILRAKPPQGLALTPETMQRLSLAFVDNLAASARLDRALYQRQDGWRSVDGLDVTGLLG